MHNGTQPNFFHEDLSMSNSPEVTRWWYTAHSLAFRGFQSAEAVEDLEQQRLGMDRIITTDTRIITVEEKLDKTTYPNIAFEVESTAGYSKGWALKEIKADVFAYGFENTNVVYYFATTDLLGAFREHHAFWKRKYGERTVWCSRAIVLPVPIEVVKNSVKHYKEVRF